MAYKQIKPFYTSKGGSQPGWCLRNVRLGYGIASKYANAITAWNKTQQHKNKSFPAGVAVPLFYTYRNDGHINVRLADGRIWNDGKIFANFDAYMKVSTVGYLGWGESVNDVRVIEYTPDRRSVTVTANTLYVRDQPTRKSAAGQANTADGNLHKGDVITILEAVTGEMVDGNNIWLKTVKGNFVWSGGTNYR